MNNTQKIYIIGGGVSGLVSACYLKKKGYSVCIIEKNNKLGGRLFEFDEHGFRFNNGPSWYWMKDVFYQTFSEIGIKESEIYDLKRLDPQYKIIFEDLELTVPGNYQNMKKLFDNHDPNHKLNLFVEKSQKKYFLSRKYFLNYENLSFLEYFNYHTFKNIFSFDLFTSYSNHCKQFTQNPYLLQILQWPALFISSCSNNLSALYSILTYSMIYDGTYLPKNGMIDIVYLLTKQCKKLGVEIILDEKVMAYQINQKNNKIESIFTNKKEYKNVDSVLASCDYHFNESLLPKKYQTYPIQYWKNMELCPSCLLFHIGLSKKLPNSDFHILFFDSNLNDHIDRIYSGKKLPQKPLFYLNLTSQFLNTAPEGCENLFILIPTGPHFSVSDQEVEDCFKYVVNRLEIYFETNLYNHIIVKKIFKDQDFKSRFNAFGGNAYGLTCHPLQTAFLKPRIRSRYIDNLFYCGQLTNPGPGLPPCLLSGLVSSKCLIKNKDKTGRFNLGESLTLLFSILARTGSFFHFFKSIIREFFYIFFRYLY